MCGIKDIISVSSFAVHSECNTVTGEQCNIDRARWREMNSGAT